MSPGDLVCFNAGGMKYKTLGLIVDLMADSSGDTYALIQWAVVGKYMPRPAYVTPGKILEHYKTIQQGQMVWHNVKLLELKK